MLNQILGHTVGETGIALTELRDRSFLFDTLPSSIYNPIESSSGLTSFSILVVI